MSEEKSAPAPANLEGELLGQIFAEDRQPEVSAPEEKKGTEQKSDAEQAPTDDKKEGDDTTVTPEGEPEKEETPADGQQKTVKLGNREFQTTEEAFAEATRVIGHNANLASELSTAKSSLEELNQKLQEAITANNQWSEWAESQEKGEDKERPNTPKLEDVVRKVLEERDNRDKQKTVEQQMKLEVDKLQALPNFNTALPMLKELATRINPTTGNHFTPLEAYEYSCWKLGLENELNQKDSKPISPAAGALKAATRPSGTSKSIPSTEKNNKPDEVDEILSSYF